ncbi:guanylate kinase [Gleimia coleocanis DSM 15436]|uniref:Guanylate kinase n=1 Tax=Gleimia coleocanis DSM 15436 TaxID=525245 RepID=C0W1K9_9ACTO|nr:guanylate kinase [Gleimia coleocanis]EEH63375.1 guanylate kinase [Gleimia coleocanis DSM 15436]
MTETQKPRLTVIAGPTAVGKGTVVRALLEKYPHVYLSVSATTRSPREGEVNGVHYHFLTHEEFDAAIERNEFLEWATVHKVNKYGTLKAPIEVALAEGKPAILEIDLAGVRQVKEHMPDARFVFIAPPSWDELVNRLRGRGTESEEEMARRLQTARTELDAQAEFDHVVINDEVDRTVSELAELLELA